MYLQQQTNPEARGGAAAIVIAAHVAVIYAIAVSLGVVEAPPIVESAKVVLLEMPKPVEPTEPVKVPELKQPDLTVPIPRYGDRDACRIAADPGAGCGAQ